jgi:hypothetical protein
MTPLETYVTANVAQLSGVTDLKTVEMIDLLWVKGNAVAAAFEVESTTTMTSALVRGSNLPAGIPKYLVIPEEREEQLHRKMKSPMFAERFAVDQWGILFFDTIRVNQKKLKSGEAALKDLTDQKAKSGLAREPEVNYSLFAEEA